MQKIYSDVCWNIDIDRRQSVATHEIKLKLFNVDLALPYAEGRIQLGLPRSGAFSNFDTSIDGQHLSLGDGFIPYQNMYSLELDEVKKRAREMPTEVTISFEETGSIQKSAMGLFYYNVDFMPRFYQSSLKLTIKTPPAESSWKVYLGRLICKLRGVPELPEIQYMVMEPTTTQGDLSIFNFRDNFPLFGILLASKYSVEIFAFLAFFIGGILISAIGSFIVWLIVWLIVN